MHYHDIGKMGHYLTLLRLLLYIVTHWKGLRSDYFFQYDANSAAYNLYAMHNGCLAQLYAIKMTSCRRKHQKLSCKKMEG